LIKIDLVSRKKKIKSVPLFLLFFVKKKKKKKLPGRLIVVNKVKTLIFKSSEPSAKILIICSEFDSIISF